MWVQKRFRFPELSLPAGAAPLLMAISRISAVDGGMLRVAERRKRVPRLRAPPIIPRLAGVAQRSADTLDAAVGVPIFQWRSDLERVLELAGRAQPQMAKTCAAVILVQISFPGNLAVELTIPNEMLEAPFADRTDALARTPVQDLCLGQKLKGLVSSFNDEGDLVFIDVGAEVEGFAHISVVHDDFVDNPRELFEVGDEVDAIVTGIQFSGEAVPLHQITPLPSHDTKSRLDLSLALSRTRLRPRPPPGNIADDIKVGSSYDGIVSYVRQEGFHVIVGDARGGRGHEGFLHISKLPNFVKSADEVAKVCDKVRTKVLGIHKGKDRPLMLMMLWNGRFFQNKRRLPLTLMMLWDGWGGSAADAHDALGWLGMPKKDCCGKGRAADAHDASGWLDTLEKAWQLMLVMLVLGLGMEGYSCCRNGQVADAHDALGWLGRPETVWQLMLVMLDGLVLGWAGYGRCRKCRAADAHAWQLMLVMLGGLVLDMIAVEKAKLGEEALGQDAQVKVRVLAVQEDGDVFM
ncbi:rps1 [Symbiodinium sp. KB8]|nr:rps1 [Symbiodinium sp. KB8]